MKSIWTLLVEPSSYPCRAAVAGRELDAWPLPTTPDHSQQTPNPQQHQRQDTDTEMMKKTIAVCAAIGAHACTHRPGHPGHPPAFAPS
jgi:hypothetical protein